MGKNTEVGETEEEGKKGRARESEMKKKKHRATYVS